MSDILDVGTLSSSFLLLTSGTTFVLQAVCPFRTTITTKANYNIKQGKTFVCGNDRIEASLATK